MPEPWADLAGWYDSLLAAGSGPHETAVDCLLRLTPDLVGGAVLDVACGQGVASRALVEAGAARVTGVDVAEPMLELARQRTDRSMPIEYLLDDATSLSRVAQDSVDGVTCQLGLMDIRDLDAALRAIHRVLRAGGWLVAVLGHPCFLAPDAVTVDLGERRARAVPTYLEEGFWRSANPNGIRGRAGNYHRTIATYLNALVRAGFRLDEIEEPQASPLLADEQPIYAAVPIVLGLRAIAEDRSPVR
jgi:ubiquinone/menaquinone biosynthesis C-methylase UbiE